MPISFPTSFLPSDLSASIDINTPANAGLPLPSLPSLPSFPSFPLPVIPGASVPTPPANNVPALPFEASFQTMGMSGVRMDIEYQVIRALEGINDDSIAGLRDIVAQVETNRLAKAEVRKAQTLLNDYKDAINNNDSTAAGAAKEKLVLLLQQPESQGGLGLPADSSEVVAARNLPSTLPSTPEARDALLSGAVQTMSSRLETLASNFSDFGLKLSTQLQELNQLHNRMISLDTTVRKGYSDTAKEIVRNV